MIACHCLPASFFHPHNSWQLAMFYPIMDIGSTKVYLQPGKKNTNRMSHLKIPWKKQWLLTCKPPVT